MEQYRTTPPLTTCFDDLADAMRAWAGGWLPTEAAAELLIGHRTWLLRQDFLDVAVEAGWDEGRPVSGGRQEVRVTRHRDALEGQMLRVLGRLRRHGGTELLVVLADGSKRMIPAAWTDAAPAGGEDGPGAAATLGTVSDLLGACVLVRPFCPRGRPGGAG